MEIILQKQEQEEVDEMHSFLESMDENERKAFLAFIRGVRFAKGCEADADRKGA